MGFGLSWISLVLLLRLVMHCFPIPVELYEGSNCKLEDGNTGVCKKIHDCPPRIQEVLEGKRSSDSAGRCGFDKNTEIVCCPFNITDKIGPSHRPAELACRRYEVDISNKLRAEDLQFHIHNGVRAEQGEFPYMVALGYQDDINDNGSVVIRYGCGGTLISSEYVLTAAHCVSNTQEKVPIEVLIGSEDLRSKGDNVQRISISNVTTHPKFKRSTNYNDVAILKLSTPVRMTSNARPICIQTKSLTTMDTAMNASYVVIGWGETTYEEFSNKLMKTPLLSFVDKESCNKLYSGFNKLPRGLDESLLCALDKNETRRADACHGDSGGPLLMVTELSHSIVGITAFGQDCGTSVPGVYTAVYSYLEWIENQVWPEINDETR